MAKNEKGADLQTALRASADPTAREAIEYLPFDLIDPDPDNFYSLDGLDKLADSIATVGLIDPIRVRHSQSDGGHYVVTSGHRRRAAIKLLIDSGEEAWRDAVPCIVDRGQEEAEWHELKLIFANSSTRQRSSSEMSREAERVEELLVALREKGFDFPGRMQDHVAQAMNTNASKLKRLHAIRNGLHPDLLKMYDEEKLSESAAYEFQKLPMAVQDWLSKKKKIQAGNIPGTAVKSAAEHCNAYLHPKCKCPDGTPCTHTYQRFYTTIVTDWATCAGTCCMECSKPESICPYRCKHARAAIEDRREQEKLSREEREAEEKKLLDANRAVIAGKYGALAVIAQDAGLKDEDAVNLPGAYTLGDMKRLAAHPDQISSYTARTDDLFGGRYVYLEHARDFANATGVSIDFLLGRTKDPQPLQPKAPEPAPVKEPEGWKTGDPTAYGTYLVWASIGKWDPDYEIDEWTAEGWSNDCAKVLAWAPLPEPWKEAE